MNRSRSEELEAMREDGLSEEIRREFRASADATARWWHRNFRMYANVQRYATTGERILVVAGQGHTAILRDLLEIDGRISARDVHPYL